MCGLLVTMEAALELMRSPGSATYAVHGLSSAPRGEVHGVGSGPCAGSGAHPSILPSSSACLAARSSLALSRRSYSREANSEAERRASLSWSYLWSVSFHSVMSAVADSNGQ